MVKEKNFKLMCSEVLKILESCPKSDVEKLPSKMINLFKENQLKDVDVNIDSNKTIFEQNVCEETLVVMFFIFRNYWATKEEKQEFDKLLKENQKKLEELYDYNNMFKNEQQEKNTLAETKNEQSENKEITGMIEYKESFFTKIKKFIKKLFGK